MKKRPLPNDAEQMVGMSKVILKGNSLKIAKVNEGTDPHVFISRVVLGLKLYQHKGLAFRAIVEGWDIAQIVEELY